MTSSTLSLQPTRQKQQFQTITVLLKWLLGLMPVLGVVFLAVYVFYYSQWTILWLAISYLWVGLIAFWAKNRISLTNFLVPFRIVIGNCLMPLFLESLFFQELGLTIGSISLGILILLTSHIEETRPATGWILVYTLTFGGIIFFRNWADFPLVDLGAWGNLLLIVLPASGLAFIGVLSQLMIRYLQDALAESEQARQNLEVRVAERTQELAISNEALLRTNHELARSNAELEQFASVASHDLQEPLRKIQAFGDRLKVKAGSTLNDESLDYLERMQNAARRMSNLINDLLAFSRVTSKAQPFVAVNLNLVVKDVLSDLEIALANTQGQVEVAPLPTVQADASQMRQLMQNLISNALKFQREGVPPSVKISGAILPDGSAEIQVQDNGIGFDNKHKDKIFILFERLHGRDKYHGTGVGLAICRKIVERHQGHITASGTPGAGANFTFTLSNRVPSH